MRLDSLLRYALISVVALSVVSCSGTRKLLNIDTAAELTVITSKDVNPDQDGRPSPIVIKVFALTDDRQFKREDFLSLYENPPERLGSDLIDTFTLQEFSPEETRTETVKLTPETQFIGLMAEYAQYDKAKALLILPVTPHKKTSYTIRAERLRIVNADE